MKWKGHWGCPSLEHQVYSEREVGPVTWTHTKTLGFGEAAESIKAIQEISVMCIQKSEIQDINCSWKTEEDTRY